MTLISVFIMIVFITSLIVLVGLTFKLIFKNPHPMYLLILTVSTIITAIFNFIIFYNIHHPGAAMATIVCIFILMQIDNIYKNIKIKENETRLENEKNQINKIYK